MPVSPSGVSGISAQLVNFGKVGAHTSFDLSESGQSAKYGTVSESFCNNPIWMNSGVYMACSQFYY